MIYFKKSLKNRLITLLDIWQIQFLLGAFSCLFIIGSLVWGTQWNEWFTVASITYSWIAMCFVYLCTFISVHRFSNYLGGLTLYYTPPVFLLWLGIAIGFLFIFRLSYSVYFLTFSSISMLLFFILVANIKRNHREIKVSYIPIGRIDELPKITNVIWKKLVNTNLIDKSETDIIMADLRADLPNKWEKFLAQCTLQHIPVFHSGRLIEMLSSRVKIDHMYENELGSLLPSKSYQATKRLLDIGFILLSSPVIFPIMLVTAILIFLEAPGNVFFLQERIGQGGTPFTVYKFRSMCQDSEKAGAQFAQANDMRVTRVGKVIRKTRIDELPQLFNVLKGEMSLIGPRPEQKKFVDEFKKEIPFYDYRHIVKPGISGWAQVVHGYAADTEDTKIKLEYDFYYIKNFSFSLDLLIFFKTIQTILTGFGAR